MQRFAFISGKIGLAVLMSVLFCVSALSVQPVEGTTYNGSHEDPLSVLSCNVQIDVYELNLTTRRASMRFSPTIQFNFIPTNEYVLCDVFSFSWSYVGELNLTRSGGNFYQVKEEMREKRWNVFFRGSPELYPFDRYEFNITFVFRIPLDNNTLPIGNRSITVSPVWPTNIQWEGPLDMQPISRKEEDLPSMRVTFAFQRPSWQAYATITPILFMFFMIGFSGFLETDKDELEYRFSIYIAVLLLAIGYFALTQGTLPPGRHYISTTEALMYGIIGASVFFFAFSLVSYKTNVNHVVCDAIAAASSIAFTCFIVFTFYVNPALLFTTYTVEKFLSLEWSVSGMLLAGVLTHSIHYMYSHVKIRSFRQAWNSLQSIQEHSLDKVIRAVYRIGFALHVISLLVSVYVVSISGRINLLGPVRELIFRYASWNFGLVVLGQLSVSLFTILGCYYIFRRLGVPVISDIIGIFLLMMSIPDFINSLYLFPYPQQIVIWIVFLLLSVALGILLLIIRQFHRTARKIST